MFEETLIFKTNTGKIPFESWFTGLPLKSRVVVDRYISRLETVGLKYSAVKFIENGVFELRIFYGPGLRVYFGVERKKLVLLVGGDKSSQSRDIKLSKSYWKDYGK